MRPQAFIGAALAAAFLACTPAVRRPVGPMITDRPDFTESAVTVAPGYHQLEMGQTVTRESRVTSLSIGEALLRSGLTSRSELRLTASSFAIDLSSPARPTGFDDANIGVKVALREAGGEARRWMPAVAVIAGTSIPVSRSAFASPSAVPEAKLLAAWELTDRLGFASNVNWSYLAEPWRHSEWAASASFAYAVTGRVGTYAEAFAFAERDVRWTTNRYVNGGMTVLLTPVLQLDARIGVGPSATSRDGFAGVGLSRRW